MTFFKNFKLHFFKSLKYFFKFSKNVIVILFLIIIFVALCLGLDLDEGGRHSLHVGLGVVEGHPAAPNWILVL